jgi:hypothetical protein
VIAQLLIMGGMSLCATVAGVIIWLLYRNESLEDTELQRNFLIVFGIFFGLGWAVLRTDTVRMHWDPAFRIKTEIEANALYKTLNEIDESGTGTTLRRSLEAQMIAGASLTEALAGARPLLSEAARYRLGFADQQTRIMWARYVADTLRELQQKDPERCYVMMSGDAFDARGGALSAENTKAFHAALIRLYESSDRSMRRERSPTDVAANLDEGRREFAAIKDELTRRYGAEVATAITSRKFGDSPPASAVTMCRARIFQLEEILKRPQGPTSVLVGDALR